MKGFVIPVIIGATGIVTRGLKRYLETIPGKHSINSLQKNSLSRNIAYHKESATIRNLKPEWWGSPLIQEEKYQENPVKDKKKNNNNKLEAGKAKTRNSLMHHKYKNAGLYRSVRFRKIPVSVIQVKS
jgi:hypothetical protein